MPSCTHIIRLTNPAFLPQDPSSALRIVRKARVVFADGAPTAATAAAPPSLGTRPVRIECAALGNSAGAAVGQTLAVSLQYSDTTDIGLPPVQRSVHSVLPLSFLVTADDADDAAAAASTCDACGVAADDGGGGEDGGTCRGCDEDGGTFATLDCSGECSGNATFDNENVCCPHDAIDCHGYCYGDAVPGLYTDPYMPRTPVSDLLTYCCASSSYLDCLGVCFGSARLDDCGVCWGGHSDVQEGNADKDCDGVCFGSQDICAPPTKKPVRDHSHGAAPTIPTLTPLLPDPAPDLAPDRGWNRPTTHHHHRRQRIRPRAVPVSCPDHLQLRV